MMSLLTSKTCGCNLTFLNTTWLGMLEMIQAIDIPNNKLSTFISLEMLQAIGISNNNLSAFILNMKAV